MLADASVACGRDRYGYGPPALERFAPLLLIALAAGLAFALCLALRPLMMRYALARPNARSSHRTPTPQGGGIAVLAGAFLALGLALLFIPMGASAGQGLVLVMVASTLLAVVGAWDDIRPLSPALRLPLQFLCVGIVVFYAAPDMRLLPETVPLWAERGLALVAGAWFVNLVNFMDGLDLMTVAEVVPVTAALLLLGLFGDLSRPATFIAMALCGAMLGFAPFNKPVAKVFLGDVGSLPIGLLLGWCLLELAWRGQPAAALLLPAYYLADSTITLFRRIIRREPFWSAHRTHFYQRATDNGFTVLRVTGEVFALNLLLALLAIATVRAGSTGMTILSVLAGAAAVGFLLRRFSRAQAS